MSSEEDRYIELSEIILHANAKALEAVKDMPRDMRRLMAFAEAWKKACEEYIDAREP